MRAGGAWSRGSRPGLADFAPSGLVALLALVLANPPATTAEPSNARDAVLITVDTLRADVLGFAGHPGVATPALDRLAAAGRVFTSAHAHCVTTLPSHASMLTGLHPFEHGVRHNGGFVLSAGVPTLATALHDAGFATGAFVGAFPLDARFGLDRGFEVYDDDVGTGTGDSHFLYSERRGDEVVARGREWWRANEGRRRFLWLHLFDPHAPYEPPEPFGSRYATNPYLGEVAAVDAFLTPLLDGFLAGQEEPALIVFTSDHGEALGEHGEATHGLFAYEPTLKVPMVLWGAGVEPGADGRTARHVDLLPTFLTALGLEVPADLPGRSLLAPAEGHPDITLFEALSGNLDYGWAPLRGVLRGADKLIALPVPELYDLEEDPQEARNLFREQQGSARELARLLPAESDWPPASGAISAEDAARLESLGYLGGPTVRKERYTPEDDPKNLVGLDHKVARMLELAIRGDAAAAIALGREVLAARPTMGVVYVHLSTLLIQAGEPMQAIEVMRRAESRGVAGRELQRQLGLTLVQAGRPREALAVLEPLAEGDADVEAGNHLALALARLGRSAEAKALLERLLAADPAVARTHENLSYLAIVAGRFVAARDHARKALDLDPSLASSWNNLAIALFQLGSSAEAVEAWQRALELAPGDLDARLNLGLVQAQLDETEAARATLNRFLEAAPSPAWDAKKNQAREALRQLGDG